MLLSPSQPLLAKTLFKNISNKSGRFYLTIHIGNSVVYQHDHVNENKYLLFLLKHVNLMQKGKVGNHPLFYLT